MELIKDKWYKLYDGKVKLWHRDNHSWFIKFNKLEGNAVKSKEYIYTGDSPILNMGGNFGAFGDYTYKLADMNEVSKFLPDGHSDKIENLVGRYVRVSEKLRSAEGIYGFKVGDILKVVTADSDSNQEARSTINSGHYFGYNCIQDGRLELLPIDFKFNENSMNKVEAPKTFAIKSDSKHLLKACWEELESMGYKRSFMSRDREFKDFICNNLNRVTTTSSKDEYSEIYINGNVTITAEVVFTLPQDYNKAIEYAKSAINSEYWNQSKAKKMKFGSLEIDVEKGKGYVDIAEGRITKEDLKKVIDWKSDKPKLLGYPVSFKRLEGDVSFGCKDGTWEQLYDIYNAM